MEHTKRQVNQVLDSYDTRKKRERLKATTKHFLIALPIGFILGMIFGGFK